MGSQEAFHVVWGSCKGEAAKSKRSLLAHNDIKCETVVGKRNHGEKKKHMAKLKLMQRFIPSCDYCLYLDTDTKILGSIQPIFDILSCSNSDIVMALAPVAQRDDKVSNAFPTFNSGVIGFRASAMSSILGAWASLAIYTETDQAAIRSLLYTGKYSYAVMRHEYNFRPHFSAHLTTPPVIVHGRGWGDRTWKRGKWIWPKK